MGKNLMWEKNYSVIKKINLMGDKKIFVFYQ
jgi:hypothetical protein